MTSQGLVTKCPWTWHNQSMHHCHYGLSPPCANMEQMHTGFILMTIMQNMIFNFYMLFGKAVCMYALSLCLYSNIAIVFSLLQEINNQAHT